MCWLSLVVRSPPARRSLSWIQSLLIELWLLVTEVSTLSLILLTTQTMVTTGILPLPGKIAMVGPGIEPGTSWLVVRSSDHQTTRLVRLINVTDNNDARWKPEISIPWRWTCKGRNMLDWRIGWIKWCLWNLYECFWWYLLILQVTIMEDAEVLKYETL